MKPKFVMYLDPEYDGGCPCSHFEYKGHRIDTHCWRSSFIHCSCNYSGLHILGPNPEAIKDELLDEISFVWNNTEWEVVCEKEA